MTTRPPAGGFQTCRRCGADLAAGAAFCPECGAPAHASAAAARGARAPRPWWVPAAIILGGIAAIAGGALLAIALDNGDGDGTAAGPSAGATSSVAASASVAASESASAEPTPSPTPAQAPVIANRSIVEVGDEPLNLREQPSDSASVLSELAPGLRLFTIGEPTDAGELRWYRVGVVNRDCADDCSRIGHVATPIAADEEPWIAEVAIDCPSSPMTVEALVGLAALEALHCYGRTDIVVTGTIDTPASTPPVVIEYTPEWLAGPAPAQFAGPGGAIGFHAAPDSDLEVPERGDVVRVTGHFEDPAATSCRASPADGQEEPVEVPQPARVVLDCRATFVWTDYEVTGSEDLGP